MKYFLIAGEASGDLHASNLMKQIKLQDPEASFMFLGGDLMQEQGGQMLVHYREMAYMGVVEVLANIGKVKKNFAICKQNMLQFQPHAVILVDYPGFNLKMAKFAKQHQFPTFYYISPKIWAWKKRRAYTIKKYVDKMFAIFPFEIDFYKQFGYSVQYVGNPLTDAMRQAEPDLLYSEAFRSKYKLGPQPIIALVPGSRKNEISKLLPEMLAIVPKFPHCQFVITGAPGIDHDFYTRFFAADPISAAVPQEGNVADPISTAGLPNVKIIFGDTYNVVKNSAAAAVASGTATLETAFLKTPQVVCYKMNTITYWAAKTFVKIKWFSLVNIIAGREVVKELLQSNLSGDIAAEISKLLSNQQYRQSMLDSYQEIRNVLGDGLASGKTAKVIVDTVREK